MAALLDGELLPCEEDEHSIEAQICHELSLLNDQCSPLAADSSFDPPSADAAHPAPDGNLDSSALESLHSAFQSRLNHAHSVIAPPDPETPANSLLNFDQLSSDASESLLSFSHDTDASSKPSTDSPVFDDEREHDWAAFRIATSNLVQASDEPFLRLPTDALATTQTEPLPPVVDAANKSIFADVTAVDVDTDAEDRPPENVTRQASAVSSGDIRTNGAISESSVPNTSRPGGPKTSDCSGIPEDEQPTQKDDQDAETESLSWNNMKASEIAARGKMERMQHEADERERLRQKREDKRRVQLLRAAKEEAACRIIGRSALVWRRRREQAIADVHRAAEESTGSQLEAAAAAAEAFGCGKAADVARERWRALREDLRAQLGQAAENGTAEEVERLKHDAPRLGLSGDAAAASENVRRKRRAVEGQLQEDGPTEDLRQQAYVVGASDALKSAEEANRATEAIRRVSLESGPRELEEVIMCNSKLLKAETVASAREQLNLRSRKARASLASAINRADRDGVNEALSECRVLEISGWLRQAADSVLAIVEQRVRRQWSTLTYAVQGEMRSAPEEAEETKALPALEQKGDACPRMLWPPQLQEDYAIEASLHSILLDEESAKAPSFGACDFNESDWVQVGKRNATQGDVRSAKCVSLELTCGDAARQPDLESAEALRLIMGDPASLGLVARAAPNLSELRLSGNGLTSADGLESLEHLAHLDLSWNKLQDADALNSITSLRSLNLGHNGLKAIPALAKLSRLECLDISGNQLQHVPESLPSMPLQELKLNSNVLSTLSLPSIYTLHTLHAQDNSIAAIAPLVTPNLRSVDLTCNELTAVKMIAPLAATSWKLKTLSLGENPCASMQRYKQEVLAFAPTIALLDGEPLPCTASWGAALHAGLSSPAPPAKAALHLLAERSLALHISSNEDDHRELTCFWAHDRERRWRYSVSHRGESPSKPLLTFSRTYFERVKTKKENAALRIQCAARDFLARRRARALRSKLEHQKREREINAAKLIQAVFKGMLQRRGGWLEHLKASRHNAAVTLQAFARGWRDRTRIRQVLSSAQADDNESDEFVGIDMSELEMPEEIATELNTSDVNIELKSGHEWADISPEPSTDIQDPLQKQPSSPDAQGERRNTVSYDDAIDQEDQISNIPYLMESAESADDTFDAANDGLVYDVSCFEDHKCESVSSAGSFSAGHAKQQQQQSQEWTKGKQWRDEVYKLMIEWGFSDVRTAEAFLRSRERAQRKRRENEKRQKLSDPSTRLKRFYKVASSNR
jgi:hypothetical protein